MKRPLMLLRFMADPAKLAAVVGSLLLIGVASFAVFFGDESTKQKLIEATFADWSMAFLAVTTGFFQLFLLLKLIGYILWKILVSNDVKTKRT